MFNVRIHPFVIDTTWNLCQNLNLFTDYEEGTAQHMQWEQRRERKKGISGLCNMQICCWLSTSAANKGLIVLLSPVAEWISLHVVFFVPVVNILVILIGMQLGDLTLGSYRRIRLIAASSSLDNCSWISIIKSCGWLFRRPCNGWAVYKIACTIF